MVLGFNFYFITQKIKLLFNYYRRHFTLDKTLEILTIEPLLLYIPN